MASYPPLINLTQDQRTRLHEFAKRLIINHQGERDAFQNDLVQAQKEYWARPVAEKKTFPFKGAANIIIPLTAITFETVHARVMTTAFGIDQKIASTLINPQYADFVTPIENMMEYELRRMKFKNRVEPSIMEVEKFGTGIGKVSYKTVTKTGVFYEGGVEQEFPVTVQRGSFVDATPLSRFYWPFDVGNKEDAYFLGEEFDFTMDRIREAEDSQLFYKGSYKAVEFLFNYAQNKFTKNQQDLENRKPVEGKTLQVIELWCSFDLTPGKYVELVIHFSLQADIILSCRYNWKKDLSKPYHIGVYIPVEHRLTGVGICKQNEAFQREITTMHRQRLDNGTIANMQMFVVSRMAGIQPNEPIYPGKVWFVDNPDQIQALKFGEINSSAFNNEHLTLMYSQQRTGVNEVTLGMPQVGTPGTATDTLSRVQEGNKKFDYCYGNIKSFLDDIINDLLINIQQFGPRTIQYYINAENGQLVEKFLELPEFLIREGLILQIKSAGQNSNKVLDRNNWQQIAGMMEKYYTVMFNMAVQLGDANLAGTILKRAFGAATETTRQMLDTFDVKNIDRLIMTEFLNTVGQNAAMMPSLQQMQSLMQNVSGASGSQGTEAVQ